MAEIDTTLVRHPEDAVQIHTSYQTYARHKKLVLVVEILILVILTIVALCCGSSGLSLQAALAALVGQGDAQTLNIVWKLRMPRILTALLGGFGLALAGCAFQSVLRNPLASASTLGISQGAAFGAALAIIVFGAGSTVSSNVADAVNISNPYIVTACAFAGAMLSTGVVLGLSRFRQITPEAMVLAGVALSALFSGGTALLQYFASDVRIAAVVFWTFGDLGRTSYTEVGIIAIMTAISALFFLLNRWNYNAMESGETSALSLGVNANRVRLASMVVGSLMAATVVAFVGIISFIGLIAPHVMRRFIGNDYRYLLPASALMGAIMLLASDLFARMIIAPVILPIGAITSFLGAPLFLYLLFKGVSAR